MHRPASRRALLLGCLALALPLVGGNPQDTYELKQRAISFEQAWNPFVRALFGCEETGDISRETCRPHREHIDFKQYTKARKAAAKLFDLEVKP